MKIQTHSKYPTFNNRGGFPTREIKETVVIDGMSPVGKCLKRTADIALSSFLILCCSPLYLICYIAIKREDRGPAIFRQERIGLHGKPFHILKFRSMKSDSELNGPALYQGDDDPRLTVAGRFLREHHLDELPQLVNVLKGDMTFVGHRPERRFYIDRIIEQDPRYESLYQCRPGVTSIATLRNGYTDAMDKMLRRLRYDLFYLRHRSWLLDMKILAQTFFSIVGAKKF